MATRGVLIDFDFTAMNGAELLFETAKSYLRDLDGIKLDVALEARYLAGNGYQDGLTALLQAVKSKKTAQRAARELAENFAERLLEEVPSAVSSGFVNFVKTLVQKGVKVVIMTRADIDGVRDAFSQILGENVVLSKIRSACYGAVKWDSWRKACIDNEIGRQGALAVTGSGYGVRAALFAGIAAMVVANEHVTYQDFTGADAICKALTTDSARKALEIIKA